MKRILNKQNLIKIEAEKRGSAHFLFKRTPEKFNFFMFLPLFYGQRSFIFGDKLSDSSKVIE